MTYPVYRGSDGLAHGSMPRADRMLSIACELIGKRDFIVEKDPLPRGTTVTCVPCIAALMGRR